MNNEKLREACLAALYEITGEEQYLLPLIEKLEQGAHIDVYVQSHLLKVDKSGKFKEVIERHEALKKEQDEKKRIADEIGVENWEPSEEQLEKFRSKHVIDMAHCKAQKLHPTLLTLEDITEVELCDNRLTTVPVELATFKNLKKLNLQANRFAGTLDENIGLLTSLEELGFHGNKIEGT